MFLYLSGRQDSNLHPPGSKPGRFITNQRTSRYCVLPVGFEPTSSLLKRQVPINHSATRAFINKLCEYGWIRTNVACYFSSPPFNIIMKGLNGLQIFSSSTSNLLHIFAVHKGVEPFFLHTLTTWFHLTGGLMDQIVIPSRLEREPHALKVHCSNQLSYETIQIIIQRTLFLFCFTNI